MADNASAAVVEGTWKDFVFKMAQPEDTPRILELLRRHFYPGETLCSQLCKGEKEFDDMAEDFKSWVVMALADNLSFFAEHKATKKVVGVRVTSLAKKGDDPEMPPLLFPPNEIIVNFLIKASTEANIFSAYPDIDHYADFFMTTTDSEFRGQGLASEMYRRAMKLFVHKKIPLCKSVLTSKWTQRACTNLGFDELVKLYLKDYKDPDNGNLYFPDAAPDLFITVVAKRIKIEG